MHTPIRQDVFEHALHVIQLISPIAEAIARRDRDLASQLRRAASSVALNIAEGFGSQAGNARLRFDAARGSLYESDAAIRVAVAWGYVSADGTRETLAAIDALGGRVFGLARR